MATNYIDHAQRLDEMILAKLPLEEVVAFLESHEDDVEGIYQSSAFVYDLYDLYTHQGRDIGGFLLDHIHLLPNYNEFFATESYVKRELDADRLDVDAHHAIRARQQEHDLFDETEFRTGCGWLGANHDIGMLDGRTNLQRELKSLQGKGVQTFLSRTMALRSAFMLENYRKMSSDHRARLLMLAQKRANLDTYYIKNVLYIETMAVMVVDLLRQLLLANEVHLFNWTTWMLDWSSGDVVFFKTNIMSRLREFVPRGLFEKGCMPFDEEAPLDPETSESMTLPNMAFELNLMGYGKEHKFVELFIYILLFHPRLYLVGGDLDMLEYLNLPFDYMKLLKERDGFNPMAASAIRSRLA